MKNIGILTLLVAIMSFTNTTEITTIAGKAKVETITFLTSAICGECKERIEKELNYTKGVVFAELDLDSKKVTVKYKTKFLDEAGVKKVVSELGYDAGNMKRNETAFNELPKCCQSPGHCSRD